MTTIYEEVREQVVTKKPLYRVCDWCGNQIIRQGYGEPYDTEITVEVSLVNDLGGTDGYSYSTWKINDLCITCTCKLRKLLQDNGLKLTADDGYHDDICEERGVDIGLYKRGEGVGE